MATAVSISMIPRILSARGTLTEPVLEKTAYVLYKDVTISL